VNTTSHHALVCARELCSLDPFFLLSISLLLPSGLSGLEETVKELSLPSHKNLSLNAVNKDLGRRLNELTSLNMDKL